MAGLLRCGWRPHPGAFARAGVWILPAGSAGSRPDRRRRGRPRRARPARTVAHRAQQGAVMADQHHGAFKFVERHRGLHGGQGSRWLVGSSSSSRLGRCQTIMASTRRAFFRHRSWCPRPVDHVTAEVEAAQKKKAAQVLFAGGFTGVGAHLAARRIMCSSGFRRGAARPVPAGRSSRWTGPCLPSPKKCQPAAPFRGRWFSPA